MIGLLEKFWIEKNKVKINEIWYDLAEVVNPEYVQPLVNQKVFFQIDESNPKMICFIKKSYPSPNEEEPKKVFKPYKNPEAPAKMSDFAPASDFKQKTDYWLEKEKRDLSVQIKISRQWALNTAIEWIKNHNTFCKPEEKLPFTEQRIKDFALSLLRIRDEIGNNKSAEGNPDY